MFWYWGGGGQKSFLWILFERSSRINVILYDESYLCLQLWGLWAPSVLPLFYLKQKKKDFHFSHMPIRHRIIAISKKWCYSSGQSDAEFQKTVIFNQYIIHTRDGGDCNIKKDKKTLSFLLTSHRYSRHLIFHIFCSVCGRDLHTENIPNIRMQLLIII